MTKTHIIGVDISKNTFDFHCYGDTQTPAPLINSKKGFNQFDRWLKKRCSTIQEEVLIVMEYTGIYTYNIERFLDSKGWPYVKRPALDIKRSTGIQRGKNDQADARMISKYGWQNKETLQPMKPTSDTLIELQSLMSYRDKLVADRASHTTRFKELKEQMGSDLNTTIKRSAKAVINLLTEHIKQLECSIRECLKKDNDLQRNYDLLISVRGIGFVCAVTFLITTENFTRFHDPRKFACYSGVAPFTYTSGTSIRGKTKVSQLANKRIKSLLTMAALSAIQSDPDLKNKYEQKVKEGKAKMSVINIIRFKLIERVFAVINRQSPYILKIAA